MVKMTHFSNVRGESLTDRVNRREAEHRWCFYCQILKNVVSDSQGNSAWAFPLSVQFVVRKRNRWLGDGWPFTAGRGGEQHFPGRFWCTIACTKGARKADCVLCWWGWAKEKYDKVGKGYLESTVVEGLGGTHQVLERCVRLNLPVAALEGLFCPRFCTVGCLHTAAGALCGCSHPVQPWRVRVASAKWR